MIQFVLTKSPSKRFGNFQRALGVDSLSETFS